MTVKCATCRLPIVGPVGRTWGGELKRVWCGNGATYSTKRNFECAACTEKGKNLETESRRKTARKNLADYVRMARKLGLARAEAVAKLAELKRNYETNGWKIGRA